CCSPLPFFPLKKIFSINLPKNQKMTIQITIIVVFIGFFVNSKILTPIYAKEKIITDFPKKTANINRFKEMFDKAATTLMTADGANGKQSKTNKRLKPRSSTHFVTLSTCLFSLILIINLRLLNFRTVRKTPTEPKLA